ncbi:MAG TPA: GNAT family N-acetyltransferase [Acidimicrobiales bacterium]|nr:GNAT family N-acetyltransferase [Acidimicrobiales bacterium]
MTFIEDAPLTFEVAEQDGRVTVTARDAAGAEVGRAWLDPTAHDRADNVGLVVPPANRRRGIGSQLLQRLLELAVEREVAYLTCTHPDDIGARQLMRATHAICSRRVADGTARDVVLVPAA